MQLMFLNFFSYRIFLSKLIPQMATILKVGTCQENWEKNHPIPDVCDVMLMKYFGTLKP